MAGVPGILMVGVAMSRLVSGDVWFLGLLEVARIRSGLWGDELMIRIECGVDHCLAGGGECRRSAAVERCTCTNIFLCI